MAVTLQRETTEYVYFGFTGDVPSVGAEVAFLTAGIRPTTEWKTAVVVPNDAHSLWDDAVASGVVGDYYVARLIGSFGSNDLVLTAGDYQPWVRLTGAIERPVRIAPVTVTIA
jgi:hypothetical protein